VGIKGFIDRHHHLRIAAYSVAARLLVRPRLAALRVPIVAVTGTNGKSTVVKLIARCLGASGLRVGACTTDGVIHAGRYVTHRDEAGAAGAWRAARCPGVRALVLETARGSLIEYGPGFHRLDAGVVTNVLPDHLGSLGVETLEQLARVKAAVPRRVHRGGTVVLNADDRLVGAMPRPKGVETVFFTLEGRQRSLARCWFLAGGEIWRKGPDGERPVIGVGEIPLAIGGAQPHMVANAMAALAACEALGARVRVDHEMTLAALREFGRDPRDNARRSVLLRGEGIHVLLAECKNPASLAAEAPLIGRLARALGCDATVGILTAPGGRRDEHYREISRAVAPLCDRVWVRAPAPRFLRGRTPERFVDLLSSALPPGAAVPDDGASIAEIIERVRSGGWRSPLCVVFYGFVERDFDLEGLLARHEHVPIVQVLAGEPEAAAPEHVSRGALTLPEQIR
jgi:cyanophycin synthetase